MSFLNNEPVTKDRIVRSLPLLRYVVNQKAELNDQDYASCPLTEHEDATPSFHVFSALSSRARYYCHGCHRGGDIFNYLFEAEKLPFGPALSYLSGLVEREIITDKNSSPHLSSSPRGPEYIERAPGGPSDHTSEHFIQFLMNEIRHLRHIINAPIMVPLNEDPTFRARTINDLIHHILNPAPELLSLINNDTATLICIAAYLQRQIGIPAPHFTPDNHDEPTWRTNEQRRKQNFPRSF